MLTSSALAGLMCGFQQIIHYLPPVDLLGLFPEWDNKQLCISLHFRGHGSMKPESFGP